MPRTDEVEDFTGPDRSVTSELLLERQQIDRVRDRLRQEFGHHVPADEVDQFVDDAVDDLGEARIRTFLPILVERMARGALRQRGAAESPVQEPAVAPRVPAQGDPSRWAKRLASPRMS